MARSKRFYVFTNIIIIVAFARTRDKLCQLGMHSMWPTCTVINFKMADNKTQNPIFARIFFWQAAELVIWHLRSRQFFFFWNDKSIFTRHQRLSCHARRSSNLLNSVFALFTRLQNILKINPRVYIYIFNRKLNLPSPLLPLKKYSFGGSQNQKRQ